MSEQPQPGSAALTPSAVHRIEDICDRFEAAWKAAGSNGPPPLIEDYLSAVAEADRSAVLRELIALDMDYRRQRGERPTLEDYQRHLPEPRAQHRAGSDRNLLFGILALQMDFIDRETLIAAMHAWVLNKAKSLGQILLEQQVLRPGEQRVLEALVEKHLQRHGNDAEQSLAALAAPAALAQELRSLNDSDLRDSLDRVFRPGDADLAATISYMQRSTERPLDELRYRILRPHAKGGLGEVFVALDEDLHREVALKEIQERFADDAQNRNRFLLEAEITGRLEHPGIVPVYGLGQYADGRPFYAMRLIQGDSLKAAIERFHEADGPDRDPGERSLSQRQLLRRFVDVCNAVAYAHSRGVLHRDLKPANVMLGKYGETLVVDWGLAKPLGRPDSLPASEEATLRPQSGSGVALTQMGSTLGTPAYMSPEQASGRLDLLGPASDVYSLGATLYTLLTGRAPFSGRDEGEILEKVRRGEFPSPQQVKPKTPAALAAICLKAMALKPEERYATSLELAADVEHWLADEPVRAWSEPWRARLGRWARRHKAIVASVAALLLTAVVALSISTWVISAAQKRTEDARHQEAEQRQRAERNFRSALNAVDQMLARVGAEHLARVPQMEEERRKLLEDALRFYQGFLSESGEAPEVKQQAGQAYYKTAKVYRMLGKQDDAERAYEESRALLVGLVEQFPLDPAYRLDLAFAYRGLGELAHGQERNTEAENFYRKAAEILESLAETQPAQRQIGLPLAAVYNSLGNLYNDTLRTAEAEISFRKALAFLERPGDDPAEPLDYSRTTAASYLGLARSCTTEMRKDEAEQAYRTAINLREQLTRQHPEEPELQSELARSYRERGWFWYLCTQIAAQPDLERAFRIQQELTRDHPKVPEYHNDLAVSYKNLGLAYRETGQHARAESTFRKALGILEPLVSEYPKDVDLAVSLGVICMEMGTTKLLETERIRQGAPSPELPAERSQLESAYGEAIDWYSRSIGTLAGVLEKEPRHSEARRFLVVAYNDRVQSWIRLGRQAEAIKDRREMVKLGEGQRHFELRMRRALALAHLGEHARAVREASEIFPDGREPSSASYDLSCVYSLAAAAALRDAKLPAAERRNLAEGYAAHAVELLRKSRAGGYFTTPGNIAQMRADTDLDALRTVSTSSLPSINRVYSLARWIGMSAKSGAELSTAASRWPPTELPRLAVHHIA